MILGIDLGGTKIEGIILKSDKEPIEIERLRINTEEDKGYNQIINNIKKLVDTLENKVNYKFKKIGIGTPGTLDPETQLLKNSNSQNLNNKSIKSDLENLLGKKVNIENDANCFALAETKFGAVKDQMPHAKIVFGVIIGTGVGGGIIIDNKILYGKQGIGGEWGHTIIKDDGEMCYCGKKGCVESVISGRALQKYYTSLSGEKLSFKNIYKNIVE